MYSGVNIFLVNRDEKIIDRILRAMLKLGGAYDGMCLEQDFTLTIQYSESFTVRLSGLDGLFPHDTRLATLNQESVDSRLWIR